MVTKWKTKTKQEKKKKHSKQIYLIQYTVNGTTTLCYVTTYAACQTRIRILFAWQWQNWKTTKKFFFVCSLCLQKFSCPILNAHQRHTRPWFPPNNSKPKQSEWATTPRSLKQTKSKKKIHKKKSTKPLTTMITSAPYNGVVCSSRECVTKL